jgi:hypothetical protein
MGEVILLSLTASLNPSLVAATSLMMLLDRPVMLMCGYLLGAYTASIALGLAIVFSLPNSGAVKTTQHTINPLIDIALGVILLIVAVALGTERYEHAREHRRERKAAKAADSDKPPPRWQRELSKGSPRTTFVIGLILTLPGASYLAGISQINKLNLSTPITVLVVIGFNVVMLWMLELPLLSFAIAPEWTPATIKRIRAWVTAHAHSFAVKGSATIGALLIIKGVVALIN